MEFAFARFTIRMPCSLRTLRGAVQRSTEIDRRLEILDDRLRARKTDLECETDGVLIQQWKTRYKARTV